jgi:hypothetical protein
MKERHWTNLVSSLRQGQCILALGPEVPADSEEAAGSADTPVTYVDALKDRLAKELEEDGRRVTATNLAGVAHQYEDAEVFGQGALRSQAVKFYASARLEPSAIHLAINSIQRRLSLARGTFG